MLYSVCHLHSHQPHLPCIAPSSQSCPKPSSVEAENWHVLPFSDPSSPFDCAVCCCQQVYFMERQRNNCVFPSCTAPQHQPAYGPGAYMDLSSCMRCLGSEHAEGACSLVSQHYHWLVHGCMGAWALFLLRPAAAFGSRDACAPPPPLPPSTPHCQLPTDN